MRTAAILICTLLVASTAYAKGPGGPDSDPLKDKQHASDAKGSKASSVHAGGTKTKVKKRTVHVKRTHEKSPAAKKTAPHAAKKHGAAKAKKAPARSGKTSE